MKNKKKYFNLYLFILILFFLFPFFAIAFYKFFGWSLDFLIIFEMSLKDFFSIWITLFGVIGLIFNIYINNERLSKQDVQLNKNERQINQQDKLFKLQQKSNTSNRFKDGIQLLGSDNDSVVIGGIYLLDELARYDTVCYAKQVFEVLCAYLRTDTNEKWNRDIEISPRKMEKYLFPHKYQIVIDILFRDTKNFYKSNIKEYKIILNNCCLVNANLRKANLENVIIKNALLINSNFEEANLSGAILSNVRAESSVFCYANLRKTSIYDLCAVCINFYGANLEGAFLTEINTNGGNMCFVHMEGVQLSNAKMQGVSFFNAYFEGALLSNVDFSLSEFHKARMEGVGFNKVSFKSAVISYLNICGGGEYDIRINRKIHDSDMEMFKNRIGKSSVLKSEGERSVYFGKIELKEFSSITRSLSDDNIIRNKFNRNSRDSILNLENHLSTINDLRTGVLSEGAAKIILDRIKNTEANKCDSRVEAFKDFTSIQKMYVDLN